MDTLSSNEFEKLVLSRVVVAGIPLLFTVTGLPRGDILYWSLFRKKANNYICVQLTKLPSISVFFDDSIPCKSLIYNHNNYPGEYLLGSVIYSLVMVVLLFNINTNYLVNWFMFVLSVYCLQRYFISKKLIKTLANHNK